MEKILIINFKNYPEIYGNKSVELAKIAEKVSKETGTKIIVCPPHPMLSLVKMMTDAEVYAQSIDAIEGEKTTGSVTANMLRSLGINGTLLNHSEKRIAPSQIREALRIANNLKLEVCLCIRDAKEIKRYPIKMSKLIAVEPPELIGTGVSVSRAKPNVIIETVSILKSSNYIGKILCGAGITDKQDVMKAVELGVDGVLVSSAIVKASNWKQKIEEISSGLL